MNTIHNCGPQEVITDPMAVLREEYAKFTLAELEHELTMFKSHEDEESLNQEAIASIITIIRDEIQKRADRLYVKNLMAAKRIAFPDMEFISDFNITEVK